MKIRQGFVSNSSSASFVIHWRMKTMGKDVDVKEAVIRLFDVEYCDIRTNGEIEISDCQGKEYKKMVERIIEDTERNFDGSFTTTFFTAMLNHFEDFGEGAKSMALALVCNPNFGIIDKDIDNEGYR